MHHCYLMIANIDNNGGDGWNDETLCFVQILLDVCLHFHSPSELLSFEDRHNTMHTTAERNRIFSYQSIKTPRPMHNDNRHQRQGFVFQHTGAHVDIIHHRVFRIVLPKPLLLQAWLTISVLKACQVKLLWMCIQTDVEICALLIRQHINERGMIHLTGSTLTSPNGLIYACINMKKKNKCGQSISFHCLWWGVARHIHVFWRDTFGCSGF